MRILITGPCGHIGSQLIRENYFRDETLILVDNMSAQRYNSLIGYHSKPFKDTMDKAEFYDIDLRLGSQFSAYKKFRGLVKDCDLVINLAAKTDAASSTKETEEYNFKILRNVAGACALGNTPLIHLSSTSVYGISEGIADEQSMVKPQSPYAEGKLKEEEYLRRMKDQLKYVTLRFGTIIGVSPGMRFHTAVNKFCWEAAVGRPLSVWKTAQYQMRPYLFLIDATQAIKIVIEEELWNNDYKIFNVVSANYILDDIIKTITRYLPDVEINFVDHPIMNQQSYGASVGLFTEQTPWFSLCFDPSGPAEDMISKQNALEVEIMATLIHLSPIIKKGRLIYGE